jgi:Met-zincin
MRKNTMNTAFSKSVVGRLSILAVALVTTVSCGQKKPQQSQSDLEFIQSRTNSQRYAYLEAKDTQDIFLFGGSVIKTTGFTSSALNMVLRPMKVLLKPKGTAATGRTLDVVTSDTQAKLLTFKLAQSGQKLEVDFASAGNDLTLRSIIDQVGGQSTAADGYWISSGAPTVLNVQQDADTMVVDLEHTIKLAKTKKDALGRTLVIEIPSSVPGQVVVRIFLKRQKSLPSLGSADRTVALGKSKNIGFFGTSLSSTTDTQPIQRYNLGDAAQPVDHITYYLKNFPAEYEAVAKKAVLSWNKAFAAQSIDVATAPVGMDVGDPRFHVIKWFDGTDNTLGWAGVAKMIVDPDTGLVMSGSIYIQGDTLLKLYRNVVGFSQRIAPPPPVSGQLGNVTFANEVGEQPVAPFLTDLTKSFDQYMQDYYLETIAHEVGHTIGLRHNFRGSTQLTGDETASVMDYAPLAQRDNYEGPGFYDIAAVRWAYFGEQPPANLPFCTDEDLWKHYDCNKGDWGEPVQNTIKGISDSISLLSSKPIAISMPEEISSVGTSIENAYKIMKFIAEVPAASRAQALTDIDAVIAKIGTATASSSLSAADQVIASKNLDQLRALATSTKKELQAAGNF